MTQKRFKVYKILQQKAILQEVEVILISNFLDLKKINSKFI